MLTCGVVVNGDGTTMHEIEVTRIEFVMALTKARDAGNLSMHPHELVDLGDEMCYTILPNGQHGTVWRFDGFEEEWQKLAHF